MKPKIRFIVFRGKNKQFYFRIVARNGRTIAQSEGYKRKGAAFKSASLICQEAKTNRTVVFFE